MQIPRRRLLQAFRYILPALVGCLISGQSLVGQSRMTSAETNWRELHQRLNPPGELWTTIPWQIAIIPARQQAAVTGRPLFIWAMDGHPLGCK